MNGKKAELYLEIKKDGRYPSQSTRNRVYQRSHIFFGYVPQSIEHNISDVYAIHTLVRNATRPVKIEQHGFFKYWADYDSTSHEIDHTLMKADAGTVEDRMGTMSMETYVKCEAFEYVDVIGLTQEMDVKNEGDSNMDISSNLAIERTNNKYGSKAEIQFEEVKSEAYIYGHEMDNMDLKQVHGEAELKNESDAIVNSSGDLVVNCSAKTKLPRQDHQVLPSKAERGSLRCHSETQLTDHMRKHSTNGDVSVRVNVDDGDIKTHSKTDALKTTLDVHMNSNLLSNSHSYTINKYHTCVYCDAVFTRKVALDQHILKKHPKSIASVTNKILECKICDYKTTLKTQYDRHMLQHPEVHSSFKLSNCIHCNATFRSEIAMDDHILNKHPERIASVTRKIHECKECTYKTVYKHHLDRHMFNHPEVTYNFKISNCEHCHAAFKSKTALDNHVLQNHPQFIDSVTCKIHECKICSYKTTAKIQFDRHMLKHPEVKSNFKYRNCIHCNATFKSELAINYHILQKHPEWSESVTSKVYECKLCTFKTVIKTQFDRHMLSHPEANSNFQFSNCVHCNSTFKSKIGKDDHVLKQHPQFIGSVTSKIHECKICSYKTTVKTKFNGHMSKHPSEVK